MPLPGFVSKARISENIASLLRYTNGGALSRGNYLSAVQALQGNSFPGANADEPVVVFDTSYPGVKEIAQRVSRACTGNSKEYQLFSQGEQEQLCRSFRAGFLHIQQILPQCVDSGNLLLGCILCLKVKKVESGTWKNTLGLIMVNPGSKWDSEHFCEIIFHELVHQAFYLEEMIQGIFGDEVLLFPDKHLVMSAVRKCPRPFVQALHSAVVAASLGHMYGQIGNGAKERVFSASALVTLSEMKALTHLLTDNGREILEEITCLAGG